MIFQYVSRVFASMYVGGGGGILLPIVPVYYCNITIKLTKTHKNGNTICLLQCFSTAGPQADTGPREVLLEFVILVI